MNKPIKERSFALYIVLSAITFGIYHIVFWNKLSKDVNVLCDGDGKKTMKYGFVFLLNIVTVGIFGLIWRFKLAKRFQANAPRYGLKFGESGANVLVCSLFLPIVGLFITALVMVSNFNKLAKEYNDYNSLVDPDADKNVDVFADEEEVEA
ncbi:MAG: DUF4234 domain-containing protein [Clostridia bacterium]|nr:DUF4234 domain-containing protein [Clostridia bacterium]